MNFKERFQKVLGVKEQNLTNLARKKEEEDRKSQEKARQKTAIEQEFLLKANYLFNPILQDMAEALGTQTKPEIDNAVWWKNNILYASASISWNKDVNGSEERGDIVNIVTDGEIVAIVFGRKIDSGGDLFSKQKEKDNKKTLVAKLKQRDWKQRAQNRIIEGLTKEMEHYKCDLPRAWNEIDY